MTIDVLAQIVTDRPRGDVAAFAIPIAMRRANRKDRALLRSLVKSESIRERTAP